MLFCFLVLMANCLSFIFHAQVGSEAKGHHLNLMTLLWTRFLSQTSILVIETFFRANFRVWFLSWSSIFVDITVNSSWFWTRFSVDNITVLVSFFR